MNRRNFIQNSCFACLAAGAGFSMLSLESCSATKVLSVVPDKGTIKIDTAQFEAGSNSLLVRTKTLEHDILILHSEDTYKAIYLQCSHQNNPVNFVSNKIVCNTHGSQFDLKGNVKLGPATKNLKTFDIQKENSILTLTITE